MLCCPRNQPLWRLLAYIHSEEAMARVSWSLSLNMAMASSPFLLLKPSLNAKTKRPLFSMPGRPLCISTLQTYPPIKTLAAAPSSSSEAEVSSSIIATTQTQEVIVKEGGVDDDDKGKEPLARLYVGNLPYNCDSAELAGIIQNFGSVEIVEVLFDRNTGVSRGFGFATMTSIKDANAVIENLDGSQYGGRTLRVNFPDKPKQRERNLYEVFVGNLSWNLTSERMLRIFSTQSKPLSARVVFDPQTKKSKGFGFLSFASSDDAEEAVYAFNETNIEGRTVRVYLADSSKRTNQETVLRHEGQKKEY